MILLDVYKEKEVIGDAGFQVDQPLADFQCSFVLMRQNHEKQCGIMASKDEETKHPYPCKNLNLLAKENTHTSKKNRKHTILLLTKLIKEK